MRILVIISLFVLTGCELFKPVKSSVKETYSVEQSVVPRDTIIKVDPSQSKLELLIAELIKGQQHTQKSGNSTVSVRYIPETETIEAECECDSLSIAATLFDRLIKEKIERQEVVVKKPSILERITTLWDKIFTILILLYLIYILKKQRN